MIAKHSRYYLTTIKFRKKIIISFVLLLVLCLTLIQIHTPLHVYLLKLESLENISCYDETEGDALPAIDQSFAPPAKSIHFHETSCTGRLNTRQACSVESAARSNPDWQINLFFTAPVTKENLNIGSLNALKKYDNIKIRRLNLIEYAKGTPLESMVSEGGLTWSRWRISHTSDALRYLSLYKWGGVYLDLDFVVAKSLSELAPNWAARETETSVASGALAFSRDKLGRTVAETTLRDFRDNFRGDLWGHNGPGVITRTLENMCDTKSIADMSATSCKGFEVYGPELFYPVSWLEANDFFISKELHRGTPYAYHIWNKRTASWKVEKDSAYMQLAKTHCPMIYETFGNNFGL